VITTIIFAAYSGQASALAAQAKTYVDISNRLEPTSQITPRPVRNTGIVYDVSYPQCGHQLPTGEARDVIGINGGFSNNFNPCFATEFEWGESLSLYNAQPAVNLYIWTANPGNDYEGIHITDWPHTGTNQFGTCSGTDGPACSFQYGFNKGSADMEYVRQQLDLTSIGTVFMDVEGSPTGTWQVVQVDNLAAIEGFATAIKAAGATPGIYSDLTQFPTIATNVTARLLTSAPEWIAGAGTIKTAQESCSLPFVHGARAVLSQYRFGPFPSTNLSLVDLDYVCPRNK